MNLKQYLIIMSGCTLIALSAFVGVLLFFDPFASGTSALVLFYASLLLFLVGIFSVVGFVIRHYMNPTTIVFRDVIVSARQALLFSLILCLSLLMKQVGVLSILNVVLLIALLSLLELIAISRQRT